MAMLQIRRPDGSTCPVYVADGAPATAPGVVVIQEWWGLNAQIKATADRFVKAGFRALVPDLYRGKLAKDTDEASHMMNHLNFLDAAEQDIQGCVTYLRESSKRVGVAGFCMGGALSLYAASKNERVGACVVFYGIHPNVKPDLANLKAPVLGIYAENDKSTPPDVVRDLEKQLKALGKSVEMHIYPNVDHAFFNDTRPGVYDRRAAEDAWLRAIRDHRARPRHRREHRNLRHRQRRSATATSI